MIDIRSFRLRSEQFAFIGNDLSRPECILAESDGTLWISDDRSALVRRDPDGSQVRIGAIGGAPNGIAMDSAGRLLIANIGDGKVYRLQRDGRHEILLEQFEGKPLGAANFVYVDHLDRLWITVSTRIEPRIRAVRQPMHDGYILVLDKDELRCAGTGFCFTNEIRIRDGYLYVAETALGRIVRHSLRRDGTLGPREAFGPDPLYPDARVDGIAFDEGGNLWVTEISRHALVVIAPQGEAHTVFENPAAQVIDFPTSITFAGADRRTAIVGSLRMDRLATFEAPLPGARLCHWRTR